ncbi:MAG: hypothetical protein J4N87_06845 [Chloroflexi bacterium]|nr:hypothetical protein [Chloroflexota bacterium]
MNISKLLAPRMSNRTIMLVVLAYLAIVAIVIVMNTTAASGFEVGPTNVFAATHAEAVPTIDFQTPTVHIPAPPYIIIEPAN